MIPFDLWESIIEYSSCSFKQLHHLQLVNQSFHRLIDEDYRNTWLQVLLLLNSCSVVQADITIDQVKQLSKQYCDQMAYKRQNEQYSKQYIHIQKNLHVQYIQLQTRSEPINVVVLGGKLCGKSMFVKVCHNGLFSDYHDTTLQIGKFYIPYQSHIYHINLIDTSSTTSRHRYDALNHKRKSMWNAHVFLLMYSVTSRSSFTYINTMMDMIRNECGSTNYPIFILGNKMDLTSERVVTTNEMINLVRSFHHKSLLAKEISTKYLNVVPLMQEVISLGVNRQQQMEQLSHGQHHHRHRHQKESCNLQ
jgi:GTPase SAR1 family protein